MINKKYLTIGIIGLFAVAFVSAFAYYALFSVTLIVAQPISVLYGDTMDEVTGLIMEEVNCDAGSSCLGDLIGVRNDGETERTVTLSSTDVADISVKYVTTTLVEIPNGELIVQPNDIELFYVYYSPDAYATDGSHQIEITIE